MKWKISFLIFTCLNFNHTRAQLVKFIKNPYQAKYRVYISDKPEEANQWIYKIKGPTDIRKPGEWYIVTNPTLFKEAITMFQVYSKKDADMIVYYVSVRDSAKIMY